MIGIVTALVGRRGGASGTRLAALSPIRLYATRSSAPAAMAMMIAPDPVLSEDPDEMLDLLDGLLLAGGSDIGPSRYGQAPHPGDQGRRPRRATRSELALTRRRGRA